MHLPRIQPLECGCVVTFTRAADGSVERETDTTGCRMKQDVANYHQMVETLVPRENHWAHQPTRLTRV
jgi:hypothetical protein